MSKSVKGLCLFFDWIEELELMESPEDAWSVVVALRDYTLEGIDPTERFSGPMRALVSNMFNQIKRAEAKSATQRANVQKRWENGSSVSSGNTDSEMVSSGNTTVIPTDTTVTVTVTDTDTVTDTNNILYNNNNEYSLAISAREPTLDRAKLKIAILNLFKERGYKSSAIEFFHYNEDREWKGTRGEDVRTNIEKYAAAWERKHYTKGWS